ncbi:hypothetical protein KJA13_00555 [Patescibacteria group bacterium]|nr:hypothetical protein [Patescibacteria group bacterium]
MAKFTEKQLISKLQELQQIKPRQDWVVFTKEQVLGEEKPVSGFSFISFIREIQRGERFIFQHKPAFATLLVLAILFGLFGFAQNSVPGDTLFSIKKIAEKGQVVFISEKDQPKHDLELANKRLDDLTKIAQENEVKNLAPAINEYQESASKAAESLAKMESKDPEIVKEIVEQTQKLEESKQILIEVYGVAGLEKEQANLTKIVIEWLIEDLENSSLTEEQEEVLAEVKEDYEAENYSDALEKILLQINNN